MGCRWMNEITGSQSIWVVLEFSITISHKLNSISWGWQCFDLEGQVVIKMTEVWWSVDKAWIWNTQEFMPSCFQMNEYKFCSISYGGCSTQTHDCCAHRTKPTPLQFYLACICENENSAWKNIIPHLCLVTTNRLGVQSMEKRQGSPVTSQIRNCSC